LVAFLQRGQLNQKNRVRKSNRRGVYHLSGPIYG
jgi:hypothetical protein